MPRWKHHLDIKSLFQPDAEDHDAVAVEIGPQVGARVKKLADTVREGDDNLAEDLEEIAEQFADTPGCDEPLRHFNYTLEDLYDLGDRERIWVG